MSNHAHRRPHAMAEKPRRRGWFRRMLGFIGPNQTGYRYPIAATANNRIDAALMAGYLRNEGIHATFTGDDEAGLNPVLQVGERVHILVPRGEQRRARRLIEKRDS